MQDSFHKRHDSSHTSQQENETSRQVSSHHQPLKPTLRLGRGPRSQEPWAPDLLLPLTTNPYDSPPSPPASPCFTLCGLLSDWLHSLPWLQNSHWAHATHLTTYLPEWLIPPKNQTGPPSPSGQIYCISFVSSLPHKPTPSLLSSIFVKGTVNHPGLLNPHLQSTSNIPPLVSEDSFRPSQHAPGEDLYCILPGWFKTIF